MADDSLPVKEDMPYHPTDTPRGTMYYNLEDLTDSQQIELNALKINTIREDEKYLAAHPEIRAIIILLLRPLLRHRPIIKIHEFIARFFNRNVVDIEDDIFHYLATRKNHVSERLSAVNAALSRKPPVKKKEVIDRPLDFVCGEECTCEHTLQWKLSEYDQFDNLSYKETEHWMTPQTSKSSSLDESNQPPFESDISDEVAQIIDLIGSEEEGERTTIEGADLEDDFFVLGKKSEDELSEIFMQRLSREKFETTSYQSNEIMAESVMKEEIGNATVRESEFEEIKKDEDELEEEKREINVDDIGEVLFRRNEEMTVEDVESSDFSQSETDNE